MKLLILSGIAVCLIGAPPGSAKKPAPKEKISPLEQYVQEVNQRTRQSSNESPGSLFTATGRLADASRDVRASQVYDLVTIIIADKASAVSTGATNTSRKSSVNASVSSLAGLRGTVASALSNLATAAGDQQLQAQGTTSRGTTLTTNVTAEVTDVLPNGNLVIQGRKEIAVNSEKQIITIRGIVRPDDLSPLNSVVSDRVARMEVLVDGKGVVGDAIRRPFFLYRLLLGLLPF